MISSAYDKSKEILTKDIQKLHFIAEFLVKNETMDGDQFKAVMESEFPVMEEIEAIAEAKKKASEEANANRIRREEARARLEAEAERLEREEAEAEKKAQDENASSQSQKAESGENADQNTEDKSEE